MTKLLIMFLGCILCVPATCLAAGSDPTSAGPELTWRLSTTGHPGPLARAVAREAAEPTLRIEPSARIQAAKERVARRSWIGRHPALFGAMVGAGSGALAGATLGHADGGPNDDWWTRRTGMVCIGSGVGAGLGAIVGLVAGVAKH